MPEMTSRPGSIMASRPSSAMPSRPGSVFTGNTSRPGSMLAYRQESSPVQHSLPSSALFSRPPSSILVSRPPSSVHLHSAMSSASSTTSNKDGIKNSSVLALRKGSAMQLKCSICSDGFRYQHTLPCFESFCTQCMEDHVLSFKRGTGCDCPLCKSGILLPGAVGKNRSKSGRCPTKADMMTCRVCSEMKPAHSRCPTCDEYFCEKCNKDFLRRMRIDNNFNVAEFSADDSFPGMTSNFGETESAMSYGEDLSETMPRGYGIVCQDHEEEELRFFCSECNMPICRDCKLISHERHQTRTLEEVYNERKQQLAQAIKTANANVRKLHDECAEINSKRLEVDQDTINMSEAIQHQADKLKNMVDELAETMINTMRLQNNETKGTLQSCREIVKHKVKHLQDTVESASALLDSDLAVDLLTNGQDVVQDINDADTENTSEKLWRKAYVFTEQDIDESSVRKTFGSLQGMAEGLLRPVPVVQLEMQTTFNCDQHYQHTTAIAPTSDGAAWVCTAYKNVIQRFDNDGELIGIETLNFDVDDMAVGVDGQLYLTEYNGKIIRMLGKDAGIFTRSDVYLRGICVSRDGENVIACGNDVPVACMREVRLSKIMIYGLDGKLVNHIQVNTGMSLYRICHTINREYVVSTGISATYFIISEAGKAKYSYKSSSSSDGVACDRHGLIYLSACKDDTLYLLDSKGSPLPSTTYAMHKPNAIAIDRNDVIWVGDFSKVHILQYKV